MMDESENLQPAKLDLKKDEALIVTWQDGHTSIYPIDYLRKMSPSADMRELRDQMAKNPLTVLPSGGSEGPVVAVSAELVGRYAMKISFSDGHDTGIYSWSYLRSIDPMPPAAGCSGNCGGGSGGGCKNKPH
mgnify:CR=1 FL=1